MEDKEAIFKKVPSPNELSHSFGHGPVREPVPKKNDGKPSPAPGQEKPLKPKAPTDEASPAVTRNIDGEVPATLSGDPALERYIRGLDNPEAIPMDAEHSEHGDKEDKQRLERFTELISAEIYSKVDPRLFASSDRDEVKKIIGDSVSAIVQYHKYDMTEKEISDVIHILGGDILGLGPLDELLADDDISDIMVDGPNEVFIEMHGQISRTGVRFRSEAHLFNICQRIVSRVGRHVDMASPICDARLPDGSRVNVILPPLSLKGPSLTIRKFKKERLTLDKLVAFGTLNQKTASLLEIIAACRVNIIITGGTGSGKTTLLNCLTKYIDPRERIITCEDTAELQLQQPQVVSLETRPVSAEGVGLVSMRDLVRNCLRMRPDRIIVGEVRGPEAFDLLQAMNTGHDGCMGTFHANSPRDALFRLENMVSMANLSIPIASIRQQIASSLEVIVHMQRLRDGSRKVMNITEIVGMEGDVVTMQDLVSYEITGEDDEHKILGEFRFFHLRPRFYEKARRFGLEGKLLELIQG